MVMVVPPRFYVFSTSSPHNRLSQYVYSFEMEKMVCGTSFQRVHGVSTSLLRIE